MKLSRIFITLAAIFLAGQLLKADILVLKNGERKEGNILEEKPDAIRMKYRLTPKIWDEKDFPRADIAQIIKQKPEELAIIELRKTMPAPDYLTADEYERIIQDRLRPFVNTYPGTPQAKEVEGMIAELLAEKAKVTAGEMKIEGKWLTAVEARRDEYNIKAYKLRREINEKAAAGDYVGALRTFDLLADPGRGFPASMHYASAIPEVITILETYENKLVKMIIEQPMVQKLRDNGLKGKVPPELTYLKRAIDKEIAEWQSTVAAEKKVRIRWLTIYKYDLKSIQDALKLVVAEKNKLMLLDQPGLVARNEVFTKVLRYIADENVLEAEAELKALALSKKSAQALVMLDASRIITNMRLRITLLKNEQAKEKKAAGTLGGSSAVGGSSAPIVDDRVAKAMADAEKAKEDKKAAGAGLDKKDDAGKPEDEKKPEDKTIDDVKAGDGRVAKAMADAEKSKAKSPRPKPIAVAAPVEEESSMQSYLLIGAGILIVVLLVSFLLQKKKA